MNGTKAEAEICADALGRYPCHECDPSRKKLNWLNRAAVEFLMAEAIPPAKEIPE